MEIYSKVLARMDTIPTIVCCKYSLYRYTSSKTLLIFFVNVCEKERPWKVVEGGGKKVGRGMLLGDVLSDCQPVTLSQLVKSVFVFVFVFVTARQPVTL